MKDTMIRRYICRNCGFKAEFDLSRCERPGLKHPCPFCARAGYPSVMIEILRPGGAIEVHVP